MSIQKLVNVPSGLYGMFITYGCYIVDSRWLRNQIPVERLFAPTHKTTKARYELERKTYRMSHNSVKMGRPLDKRTYYIYAFAARKYNWPFIKEAYDN